MTKQEEIKKGLTDLVFCEDGSTLEEFTDKILNYLHFKGCVIKVDREMPELPDYWLLDKGGWYCDANGNKRTLEDDLGDVGYAAVESLIEKVPA